MANPIAPENLINATIDFLEGKVPHESLSEEESQKLDYLIEDLKIFKRHLYATGITYIHEDGMHNGMASKLQHFQKSKILG